MRQCPSLADCHLLYKQVIQSALTAVARAETRTVLSSPRGTVFRRRKLISEDSVIQQSGRYQSEARVISEKSQTVCAVMRPAKPMPSWTPHLSDPDPAQYSGGLRVGVMVG